MNKKWIDFLDRVYSEIERLENDGIDVIFFRGHSNEDYKLMPSLYRTMRDVNILESQLFYDFVAMAGPKINHEDTWDILFTMRHHGIPTRLLDWTTSFATALYFAISSKELNNPHIWILDPFALNNMDSQYSNYLINPYYDLYSDYKEMFIYREESKEVYIPKYPLAIYPPRNSSRIFAQHGVFTIHGEIIKEMEGIENLPANCLTKIEIPLDCLKEAQNFLDLAGVNEYSVFPDFDGLTKYLTRKLGIS